MLTIFTTACCSIRTRLSNVPRRNFSLTLPLNTDTYTAEKLYKVERYGNMVPWKKPEKSPGLYFHYTDFKGQHLISTTGIINVSPLSKTKGRFGTGVYLTGLDPYQCSKKIAENNWGYPSKRCLQRTKYVFVFDKSKLENLEKANTERNIWVYGAAINLFEKSAVLLRRRNEGATVGVDIIMRWTRIF